MATACVKLHEKALVLPAGVEHLSLRAVVVLRVSDVRLDEHAAALESLRHLERAPTLRNAGADRAGHPCPQRTAGLGAPRAHGDDPAERIRAVRDGPWAARDVDALDDGGIEEGAARPDPAFGGDSAAVDQEQRPAAGKPTDGGHGGMSFGDLVDARDGLERLHEVLGIAPRDLRARQNRRRRPG